MKKNQVWSKEDQGLLFLIKNAPDDFVRIYDVGNVEIWEYKKKK